MVERTDETTKRAGEATWRIDGTTKRIEEVAKRADENTRNIIVRQISAIATVGY